MSDCNPQNEYLTETAQNHRLAAFHFQLAAKHHLTAVDADVEGDVIVGAFHAYTAHAHQLRAIQHAETAAQLGVIEDEEAQNEDCDCE